MAEGLESVRPGINAPFEDSETSVESYLSWFEVAERELFVHHQTIVDLLEPAEGKKVADVGAGTGLFMPALSKAVGPSGAVHCLETATKFIPQLQARKASLGEGGANVQVTHCGHTSLPFQDASLDALLMVDTYHHIEFPSLILPECRRVLKPDGVCLVVDLERIEGVSSEWVMGHVRADKAAVIQEWAAQGFSHREIHSLPLKENWVIFFFKP